VENGVFQKLKQFTWPDDDFKAMRDAIAVMVDSKPLNVAMQTSTIMNNSITDLPSVKWRGANDTKAKTPSACIPFIGVYLSKLSRYNKLSDLIDPTSPHDLVGIDAQTVNFESPAHSTYHSHTSKFVKRYLRCLRTLLYSRKTLFVRTGQSRPAN